MLTKTLILSLLTISINGDVAFFDHKKEQDISNFAKAGSVNNTTNEKWFTQLLTHDSSSGSKQTWSQRYYVNDQYYKPGGPAFLHIGGENELSDFRTKDSISLDAAKKYNGIVYSLEHRFYGKSYPLNDLSLNSLKYLSTELALGDLAHFAKTIKLPSSTSSKNNTHKTKWILQGGSYSGNLAAWGRKAYPDLFHGALAYSAPVEAKVDFYEYDLMVQKFILLHGGQKCLSFHNEVYEAIDNILMGGNEKTKVDLKAKFGCNNVTDVHFASKLTNLIGGTQQNNSTKVKDHCNSINLDGSIDVKINNFAKMYVTKYGKNACNRKWSAQELSTKKPLPEEMNRQWRYQACTEFGYFQTAAPKGFPIARPRTYNAAETSKNVCGEYFGLKTPLVPNINKINSKYGGKKYNTKNVMFINGEHDPWSALSILNSTHKLMPSIIVKGESHVPAAGGVKSKDSKEVADAKSKALAFLDMILK